MGCAHRYHIPPVRGFILYLESPDSSACELTKGESQEHTNRALQSGQATGFTIKAYLLWCQVGIKAGKHDTTKKCQKHAFDLQKNNCTAETQVSTEINNGVTV